MSLVSLMSFLQATYGTKNEKYRDVLRAAPKLSKLTKLTQIGATFFSSLCLL